MYNGQQCAGRIEFYSHSIVISRMSGQLKQVVNSFCTKEFLDVTKQYIPRRGYVEIPKKMYAARTMDKREVRIHRHMEGTLLAHLRSMGFTEANLELVRYDVAWGASAAFSTPVHMTPMDYQKPIIEFITNDNPTGVVQLQTGRGKALPIENRIVVPDGWKYMGELEVGDVVIAADGSHSEVMGVYPQGYEEVFKLTFEDGRYTLASKNHLWRVTHGESASEVVDTDTLTILSNISNTPLHIPLAEPEQSLSTEVPLNPWLLGVMLRHMQWHDGRMFLALDKGDEELIEEINECLLAHQCELYKLPPMQTYIVRLLEGPSLDLYSICTVGTDRSYGLIYAILRRLELVDTADDKRFIPEIYKQAAPNHRLDLLIGLLDGEPPRAVSQHVEDTVTIKVRGDELAEDVVWLARSLGWKAEPVLLNEKREIWGIYCSCFGKYIKSHSDLHRLPSKKKEAENYEVNESRLLKLISVRPHGWRETQCIEIAHPDKLYVTDDYITTHNTYIAACAIERLQQRVSLFISAKYIDKWTKDAYNVLGLDPKEVRVIRGSSALKKLIADGRKGKIEEHFIIFSMQTIQAYIKAYEHLEADSYGCDPGQLMQVIDCAVKLVDEAHENLHLNVKLDLYLHVKKAIFLSATLESDERMINKILEMIYPYNYRFSGVTYDRYINVKAIEFRVDDIERFRFKGRRGSYSHIEFEKSVLRTKRRTERYFKMIEELIVLDFTAVREGDDQKMLIYFASVEMCTVFTEWLKRKMPEYEIARYVSGDDAETPYVSDITVTTLQSAGTALDIDGLLTVLMTTALGSRMLNVQAMGRLRRLKKYPDTTPTFIYLMATNIPQHLEYHKRKVENFSDKALHHKTVRSGFVI